MNFTFKFLIRIQKTEKGFIGECPSIKCVPKICESKESCKSSIKDYLDKYIEHDVIEFLYETNCVDESISCPEGLLQLPIDTWHCKINKEICPIGAVIDSNEDFVQNKSCIADKKKKIDINRIINDGRYSGLHHMPGKHHCSSCYYKNIREYTKYYFKFELTKLSHFYDVLNDDFRYKYLTLDLPRTSYFGSLCPNCFKDIKKKLDSSLAKELSEIRIKHKV